MPDMPGYGTRTEPYEPPDQDGEDEECHSCKMWGLLQDGLCRACKEQLAKDTLEAQEEEARERQLERLRESSP